MVDNKTQAQLLQAQIDILLSLEKRGALDVYQTMNTPKKLYIDVINPLLAELREKLQTITNEQDTRKQGSTTE